MHYKFEVFFEVGKIFQKKGEIVYHSIEKWFPKSGNLFFGLENIFILLYTIVVLLNNQNSDNVCTMAIKPKIKFQTLEISCLYYDR